MSIFPAALPGQPLPLPTRTAVTAQRRRLWAAGYRPVAVRNAIVGDQTSGKAPVGQGWPEQARSNPPLWADARPNPEALNTGVLSDGLRAIDIDIDDPAIAESVRAAAVRRFGEAPLRYRDNSPRVLLVYRAATGEPVKVVRTGKGHSKDNALKVEVLGRGQQFVAFGNHYTGVALQWKQAPGDVTRDSLRAITEEDVAAFLDEISPIIGAEPVLLAEADGAAAPRATAVNGRQADPAKIAAALDAIPNDGPADWEEWNRRGMAIWGATGGSPEGLAAFHRWGARHPSYDAAATDERWAHYAKSPPTKIGAGTIIHDAQQAQAADDDDDKQPQREKIIDAVMAAGVRFWCDCDGCGYATVTLDPTRPDGPVAHHRVRSRRFGLIVRRLYGLANPVNGPRGTRPSGVSDSAMAEALPAFEAMALAGDVYEPAVRLTENRGAVWLDLGDGTHRAIRVTAAGWTIEERADAPLIRPDGMRRLPVPVRVRDALAKLRSLLNVGDGEEADSNFRLVVAWLVAALYPTGPYCVLAVDGEQGSGKSTVCRMLRRLVDPNLADLRAPPRNEDDLLIAALNGRVIGLDNVSFIEADTADALCRVATGAGFGTRRLYSNLEEVIVAVARPVLLNGIPSLLARGDLADRSLAVTLPPIPDATRLPEDEVWRDFDAAAPGILAALLDGLALALRRLPTLRLANLPRMADFARLACAAAPAFGWTEAEMLRAITENRAAAVHTVLAADPLAEAVQAIAVAGDWTGSATDLLAKINSMVAPEVQRVKGWPRDGARLSARLRRVAPALRRAGVEVIGERTKDARGIRITRGGPPRVGPTASPASSASPGHPKPAGNRGFLGDAEGDAAVTLSDEDRGGDAAVTLANHTASPRKPQKSAAGDAGDADDADLPYLPPQPGAAWAEGVI